MPRFKILYLSSEDPYNKKSWSGIHYNIVQQLEKHFEVTPAGPLVTSRKILFFFRWFNLFLKHVFHKKYNTMHSRLIAADHIKQLNAKLKENFDLIFATASSRELSALHTSIPILHLSDATFDLIYNYYPGVSGLLNYSVKESRKVELQAIQKASILVYSSVWAAHSAINQYMALPERVHVVPFGANIQELPVMKLEDKIHMDKFHMVFLGVSWLRKGGNIVYETFKILKERGMKVQLSICGCIPTEEICDPDITIIPFLDKNIEEHKNAFINLMQQAHLLFLPTRADCTPIVFCEAAAYGLPVITTDTGGVSSLVKNGVNGYCLDIKAGANEYANLIERIIHDKEQYVSLSLQSRELFLKELNWDSWGNNLYKIVTDYLEAKNK